jgi:probable F420-dependent oxidoreductase
VKLGLFGINLGACASPDVAARVARAAEAAGFDSVWTGEHVVLPDPQAPPSPAPPRTPFLDPLVALAHLAAHTARLRLATGIVILPQRNPLVLAKAVASLDVLSGGRALLGVGAGYLHQEFAALGVPFARRGARTDEYIDAMRALWAQEKPAFAGEFVSFSGVDAQPRPVQAGGVPIVVGGTSAGALRRAVARGHGWYGFALDPAAAARCLEGLARAAAEVDRPTALGRLEITITPPPGADAAAARRYAELGVDRLALLGMLPGERELLALIEGAARALGAPGA